jgi:hypothetical protein
MTDSTRGTVYEHPGAGLERHPLQHLERRTPRHRQGGRDDRVQLRRAGRDEIAGTATRSASAPCVVPCTEQRPHRFAGVDDEAG